jgi:hypothetical protein
MIFSKSRCSKEFEMVTNEDEANEGNSLRLTDFVESENFPLSGTS